MHHLISKHIWNEIDIEYSTRGGVYKIFLISDDVRVPVNRFLGKDEEGILYIGKANCFLDRVINLKKSIIYSSSSHEFADRFKKHDLIMNKFTIENLYVELQESNDPRKLEQEVLNNYIYKFGELPPLNRVL